MQQSFVWSDSGGSPAGGPSHVNFCSTFQLFHVLLAAPRGYITNQSRAIILIGKLFSCLKKRTVASEWMKMFRILTSYGFSDGYWQAGSDLHYAVEAFLGIQVVEP